MSDTRWERAKEIFHEARSRPRAERRDYVELACAGDAELRTEVDALIRADGEAGSFLDSPDALPTVDLAVSEGAGTRIGHYKLLQLIGEGGFGSVYMAEQEEPVRRKVAVKVIKLGMDTRQVIARFEAERQALALMDHPNIARVLDAGATEGGRPYFVMELVRGVPITEYCDRNNLSTEERLSLFLPVCSAVQHAHQKGIIHRDIKPSNVMVTLHDGVPVPKVIDFGIAKATNQRLTEKTLFTEYRQFIGTPHYMSPEQAEMSGLDVDTRTDIYSLGVLLYELLTGTTPFDPARLREMAFSEIHRVIREEDPHKPSTRVSTLGDSASDTAKHRATDLRALRRRLSGDLDWIVMKALEKDRTRRYETANALLLDIRRHLADEPVSAGPPTPSYRLRKFVRRNRTAVGVGGAVAAAVLAGLGLATFGFVQADRERAIARQEAESAEAINAFFSDMLASVNPMQTQLHPVFRGQSLPPAVSGSYDRSLSVLEMVHRAATRLGESFPDKPLLEAQARETMATTLFGLGDDDGALEQFRESLALRTAELGPAHVDVLRTRLQIASALKFSDRNIDAEQWAREVREDLAASLGDDDPLTLFAASLWATALRENAEWAASDSIYAAALERQRRVLGPKHRDTIGTLVAWAGSYCWRGQGRRAIELSSEAYRNASATYHPDDATVLMAEQIYALALTFRSRHTEAKEIARASLEKHVRIYGEDHPATRGSYFALARALAAPEEQSERRELYRKVTKLVPAVSWVAARDLGRSLMYHGETEDGLEILRSQYEFWKGDDERALRHVREERLVTIRQGTRENYKRALVYTRRWDELRAVVRVELDELRVQAEADDAAALDWNNYAWALVTCPAPDLRDPAEGLRWADRAVGEPGEADSLTVANFHDTRAKALEKSGRLREAMEAERLAVRGAADAPGIELVALFAATFVRHASELGEDREIEELVDFLVRRREERSGDEPAKAAEELRRLAETLDDHGFHDVAEAPHERAVALARRSGDREAELDAVIARAHSRALAGDGETATALVEEAIALHRSTYYDETMDWSRLGQGFADEGPRSRAATRTKRRITLTLIELGRSGEVADLAAELSAVCYNAAREPSNLALAVHDPGAALPWFRSQDFWNGFGENHGPQARSDVRYGRCLIETGDFAEAEFILERARARALEWCGPESSITREAEEALRELRAKRG